MHNLLITLCSIQIVNHTSIAAIVDMSVVRNLYSYKIYYGVYIKKKKKTFTNFTI